jgi:hypothetical protein
MSKYQLSLIFKVVLKEPHPNDFLSVLCPCGGPF